MSRKVSVRNDEETGMSEVIEVEETETAKTNESLSPWQLVTELPAARVLHTPDAFQMELLEDGIKGVTAKTGFSVLSRHPVNQQTHVRVLTDAAGTILVVLGTVINRIPVVEPTGEVQTSPTGEEIPVMRQVRGADGRPMFSTEWEIYGVAPFRSLAQAQHVAREIQNEAIKALHVVAGWGDPVDAATAPDAPDWGDFVDVNDERDFME